MVDYLKQTYHRVSRWGNWTAYTDIDKVLETAVQESCTVLCMSQAEADILSAYGMIIGHSPQFKVLDRLRQFHDYPCAYYYPYNPIEINHLL